MNGKPVVSIIIAFLNAEKFIQEAIESVLAQTYEYWELFLIDDGSTDGSTEIARSYAQQYPAKIFYLEHQDHQNHGVCVSRNLGIYHSKGEYIAILDADDVWLHHKLERQVEILEAHPEAAMVYGASKYWHSWTGKSEGAQNFIPKLGLPTGTFIKPPELFFQSHPIGKAIAPCPSDLLLRRDIVENIGGFEESFHGMYQLYEDQAFLVKIYLKAPVFVAGEYWDNYRLHPDSCVMKTKGYHSVIRLFFLDWLTEYLSNQDIKDEKIWNALQKAFWPYRHPVLYGLFSRIQYIEGVMKSFLKKIVKKALPIHYWLTAIWQLRYRPPIGMVDFGSLRRLVPISRQFGFDRGLPIDRYYIENFLTCYAGDIDGHVLEIGDNSYTRRFGGQHVSTSDVLYATEGNPTTTIVADLTDADHIPSDTFDCIILTQTLHFIYDVRAAAQTLYRILKPGGVLLATVPGISQIGIDEWTESWYWSFTVSSAQRLFQEVFGVDNIKIEAHGNVLAATAFLQGLPAEELSRGELEYRDPYYQLLITIRAVKPEVPR
jgi:glycosyltransferase involved in cell wall biosynthesis